MDIKGYVRHSFYTHKTKHTYYIHKCHLKSQDSTEVELSLSSPLKLQRAVSRLNCNLEEEQEVVPTRGGTGASQTPRRGSFTPITGVFLSQAGGTRVMVLDLSICSVFYCPTVRGVACVDS